MLCTRSEHRLRRDAAQQDDSQANGGAGPLPKRPLIRLHLDMIKYLSNALGRFVEVVGVVTALVFVFELTTANRGLPSIDLDATEKISAFKFFEANNRVVVYISFSLDRDMFKDASTGLYSDPIRVDALGNLGGAVLLVNWQSLSNSYLAEIDDHRAEDLSFAFRGPAYARLFEAEGLPYVELIASPFTDSVLERAKCAEHLFGQSTFQKVYRYVAGCMLNAVATPKTYLGNG
ncbi:hypothetical protein [Roseibium aggregatum]|uniref:Uncharacterized protein n=1 Tax=Roseibium aggregatum TaxID=187304 RepID=A0A939EJP9_9HYPH|nr:hypothetical protein [Roseibium aggregatum]MBN9672924.1 hypothetical protein [Roseibium aggregatum]